MIIFACIGVTGLFGSDQENAKSINTLIKQVYKEKMQNFVKFNCKEKRGQILNYYNRYFTNETALSLTNLVEYGMYGKDKFNEGAFAGDPRYSDKVRTGDPDDPWMHDEYRVVKKIVFLVPVVTGNEAVVKVDSLVESNDNLTMRSEFHLVKITNYWRIDNIIWGPEGTFEEKSTQGLSRIK